MDQRQQAVYDALYHEIDPEIAGLFKLACELLDRFEEPGVVFLLGHAGRELSKGVLHRIAQNEPAQEGQVALPPGVAEGGPGVRERLAELLDLDLEDGRLDEILDIVFGEGHKETIARALRLAADHPLVRSWFRLQKELVASTHYPKRRGAASPNRERAREAFSRLVGLLFNRVAPYFDTQSELDALLDISAPTPQDMARLREALVRPQLRLRFFRALKNPAWLVPLQEGGFLDSPPDWVVTSEGGWRLVAWPEGESLIRFAADAPALVVEALLHVPPKIGNPAVWQVVARGALRLPPAMARRLVPMLVGALRATPVRFFQDTVADVAVVLAKAGEEAAFDLTEEVLGLKALPIDEGPAETRWLRRESKGLLQGFDLYELHAFLGRVIPLLAAMDPIRTWNLLLGRLRRARGLLNQAGFDDEHHSQQWCSSLNYSDSEDDIRSQLAAAAIRVASELLASEPAKVTELLDGLQPGRGPLFARMRLAVLTLGGALVQDEVDRVIADPQILEPPFGAREVAALLRARFDTASPAAQAALVRALEAGPTDAGTDAGTRQEDVERWQRPRVRWFHDRIPQSLGPLAERLNVVAEKPSLDRQNLDEVGWHSGGVYSRGEISPSTTAELRAMGDEELWSYLTTWSPTESIHEGPSPSGLAGVLATLLEEDFDARVTFIAGLAERPAIPPRYAVVALEALKKRVAAKEPVPWHVAIALVAGILNAAEAATEALDRGDWAWARRAAMDFLQEAATSNALPAEHLGRAFDLAELAARTSVAWNHERSVQATHFGDIVNEMMNSDAGKTTIAAIVVALRAYRVRAEGATAPDPAPFIRQVLEVVRERNDPGRPAARAQVGTCLPQLMLLDRSWVEAHAADLLETGMRDPLGNPTWGAYVTMGTIYPDSFTALRPWFGRHAAELTSVVAGENLVVKVDREWMISRHYLEKAGVAYMQGLLTANEPDRALELSFESARPADRAHFYWQVFRGWSDASTAPDEGYVRRLLALWEWRLDVLESGSGSDAGEEADGLGWLILTPHLPDAKVLPLAVRTMRLATGSRQTRRMIWPRLAQLTTVDLAAVLGIAGDLIATELAAPWAHLDFDQVAPVLRAGLRSTDHMLHDMAKRLVHDLGDRGYTEFGALLDEDELSPGG